VASASSTLKVGLVEKIEQEMTASKITEHKTTNEILVRSGVYIVFNSW